METKLGCEMHVVVADVVVQDDSAVLLVRPRTPSDGAEGWRLPGDMLRFGEAPETGARRILRDRLGLEPEWVALAEVESSVDGGVWSLVFHFQCDADRRPAPGRGLPRRGSFRSSIFPPPRMGRG